MTLAIILGLGAALALASCGNSNSDSLLPGDTAKEIISNLDSVQAIADSGDCGQAVAAAEQVKQQIDALPPSVDAKLRTNLEEGAQRLINVLNQPDACVNTGATDTSVSTADTTTDTATTNAETTQKTKPDKSTKQPTTTTTTPTTPTTPEPPPDTTPTTPTPPGGGGTGSGGIGGIGSGGKSGGGQSPPDAQREIGVR